MADVNGDSFLDIYVSVVGNYLGLKGHNELFINNGNNTFTESSSKYGLDIVGLSTQAAFFDYDHDGDLDCYILRHSKKPHETIVPINHRVVKDSISGDRFFRNDITTSGKFTDVSDQAGIYQSNLGYGLGLAIADINNDGNEDIYVCTTIKSNPSKRRNLLYINEGVRKGEKYPHFIESAAEYGLADTSYSLISHSVRYLGVQGSLVEFCSFDFKLKALRDTLESKMNNTLKGKWTHDGTGLWLKEPPTQQPLPGEADVGVL